jgi:hypothetical protein
VGYSRRKEARELVEIIDEANRRIEGLTLGTCVQRELFFSMSLVIAVLGEVGIG